VLGKHCVETTSAGISDYQCRDRPAMILRGEGLGAEMIYPAIPCCPSPHLDFSLKLEELIFPLCQQQLHAQSFLITTGLIFIFPGPFFLLFLPLLCPIIFAPLIFRTSPRWGVIVMAVPHWFGGCATIGARIHSIQLTQAFLISVFITVLLLATLCYLCDLFLSFF
jgi:hypothetical protein